MMCVWLLTIFVMFAQTALGSDYSDNEDELCQHSNQSYFQQDLVGGGTSQTQGSQSRWQNDADESIELHYNAEETKMLSGLSTFWMSLILSHKLGFSQGVAWHLLGDGAGRLHEIYHAPAEKIQRDEPPKIQAFIVPMSFFLSYITGLDLATSYVLVNLFLSASCYDDVRMLRDCLRNVLTVGGGQLIVNVGAFCFPEAAPASINLLAGGYMGGVRALEYAPKVVDAFSFKY